MSEEAKMRSMVDKLEQHMLKCTELMIKQQAVFMKASEDLRAVKEMLDSGYGKRSMADPSKLEPLSKRSKKESKSTKPAALPFASTPSESQPIKPLKGYMLFCQVHRATVKQQGLKIPFKDTPSYYGGEWNLLSTADQKEYKSGKIPMPAAAVSTFALVVNEDDANERPVGDVTESEDENDADKEKHADKKKEDDKDEDADEDEDADNDDEYANGMDEDNVLKKLQDTYEFFDGTKLTPLSRWYMDCLASRWLNDHDNEMKPKIFVNMLKTKVNDMKELNQHIHATFEDHLSEPCFLTETGWHADVLSAFDTWKSEFKFVELEKFNPESSLHSLVLDDFKSVQRRMVFEKFDTWKEFATKLLCFCKDEPGVLSYDTTGNDDYDITTEFNTDA